MPRRILFVRLSAIGDVINALPAVAALRRAEPDAVIDFAVEDKAKDVVLGHPLIDRVVVFPKKRWNRAIRTPAGFFRALREAGDYVRDLRTRRYDVSIDCQGTLKGALHSFLSGAPMRIGFTRKHSYEANTWFSTIQVEPPAGRPHRVEKFLSLLRPLGLDGTGAAYALPEDAESRARVRAYLEEAGIDGYVILHPGTSDFAPEKRWPAERYGELAQRVVSELGLRVLVTWGPGERPLADAVCRRSGGQALRAPQTRSLMELAELIRRARAFVSADTGPMHLAAACGTPCVALFGPKDPALYGPYGTGHTVITKGRDGAPAPMESIAVEEVFGALSERLRTARGPTS